jgi:hypothetical protein
MNTRNRSRTPATPARSAGRVGITYLIGTCLVCKKCMFCGASDVPGRNNCECDKTVKPTKATTSDDQTKRIYFNRTYNPQTMSSEQLQWFRSIGSKMNYDMDFEKPMDVSLCTTHNSQLLKLSKQKNIINTEPSVTSSDESLAEDNHSATFRVSINAKKIDGGLMAGKWLSIEKEDFAGFLEVLRKTAKDILCEDVDTKCFSFSYKLSGTNGPGHILSDEADFVEFKRIYRNKASNKDMQITAVVNTKSRTKRQRVTVTVSVCIF